MSPVARPAVVIRALAATAFAAFAQACVAQSFNFHEIGSLDAPTRAVEMAYSASLGQLVLRNSASAVATINVTTGASAIHFANSRFTDLSISPDGRFVFAADYGGENIGYGTPASTSYVHRFDLSSQDWGVKSTSAVAGNIAATSADTFVLSSLDQWVTFTNNAWTAGSAVTQLSTNTNSFFPGYYASVYVGEIQYLGGSGRLVHGNSGLSSQELQSFRLVNNEFVRQEGTGMYGSAQGYGGSLVVSTDGSRLYYGQLAVDPLDVSFTRSVMPEVIYAATGTLAFGNGSYYDAHTGALLGNLGFATTVYAFDASGNEFWAFDESAGRLRHFALAVPELQTWWMMLAGLGMLSMRRRASAG